MEPSQEKLTTSNPRQDPQIDLETDAYLGPGQGFDNELGAGRSSRTERSLFDGLPNPTAEDLEYCKNPAFRRLMGQRFNKYLMVTEGISFGTDCP